MTDQPTVLLCDDSRALRMMTAHQITELGYAVAGEAPNGAVAVDLYKELRPTMVLLDLVMPEVDGKQALQEILAFDPDAKVAILSSLGAQSDIEYCLRLGAKTYLQKPIDPEVLKRVLNELAPLPSLPS